MKVTCNIDQSGRRVRLVAGIVVDTFGTGLIIAGLIYSMKVLVMLGVIASLSGTFMIVEGAIGWCALRAMGFKTKF